MKENNILIADFLGWVEQTDSNKRWFGSFTDKNFIIHKNNNKEPLLFHSDWNWLMLVVDKIESLGFFVSIKKNWGKITHNNGETLILRWEQDSTKIEAVYNSCIEFIKWYNDNKQI